MWKRPKRPWTIVIVIVLAFAGMIGRSYHRSRARDALIRELEERKMGVQRQYTGPPWLKRFLPEGTGFFHRQVISDLRLGDDELLARIVDLAPYAAARVYAWDALLVTDAVLRRVGRLEGVVTLELAETQVTDAGVQNLANLRELHYLDLSQTQVTDAGLQHLVGLEGLTSLYLAQTSVSDAGLQHLAGMAEMRALDLSQTEVTDAGLQRLAGLKKLWILNLSQTQVTGVGLAGLAGPGKLTHLNLSQTQVTDAGLQRVVRLKSLEKLDLSQTQVTDAGLRLLAGLERLEDLNLSQTQVTDAGLQHLAGLGRLRQLNLSQTQVTGAAVASLKKAGRSMLWIETQPPERHATESGQRESLHTAMLKCIVRNKELLALCEVANEKGAQSALAFLDKQYAREGEAIRVGRQWQTVCYKADDTFVIRVMVDNLGGRIGSIAMTERNDNRTRLSLATGGRHLIQTLRSRGAAIHRDDLMALLGTPEDEGDIMYWSPPVADGRIRRRPLLLYGKEQYILDRTSLRLLEVRVHSVF